MAQQDYTGIEDGWNPVENLQCRVCGKYKNSQRSMFYAEEYRGICYACADEVPGCIPKDKFLWYLNKLAERRIRNEQTM